MTLHAGAIARVSVSSCWIVGVKLQEAAKTAAREAGFSILLLDRGGETDYCKLVHG